MRGVNKVILVGTLGRDPEVKYAANGNAITNLSVATSEQWTDKNTGQKQEKTEWHRVVLFGKLAEIAGQYLRKGSQVYLEGKLQTRKWQDQNTGQDRYTTEVVVDSFNGNLQMLGGSRQGGDVAFDGGFAQAPNQAPNPAQNPAMQSMSQQSSAAPAYQNAGFAQNGMQSSSDPQQANAGFAQNSPMSSPSNSQPSSPQAPQPSPAMAANDFDDDDVPF